MTDLYILTLARDFVLELLDGFERTDLGEVLGEQGVDDWDDPYGDWAATMEQVSSEVSRMLADLRKSVSGGAE